MTEVKKYPNYSKKKTPSPSSVTHILLSKLVPQVVTFTSDVLSQVFFHDSDSEENILAPKSK